MYTYLLNVVPNLNIKLSNSLFPIVNHRVIGCAPGVCQRQSPRTWGCHPDVLWWQFPSNCMRLVTILSQIWAIHALRSRFFYLSLCDQPAKRTKKRETNN